MAIKKNELYLFHYYVQHGDELAFQYCQGTKQQIYTAAIVDAFYSDKYPLGRVKVQKLLYLLHRHQGVSVAAFKKKAAGPYADTVRYKGGEPIAKKNKYIVSESGKQGTRYSKGENIGQALDYVER